MAKSNTPAKADETSKEVGAAFDYGEMAGVGMENIGAEDVSIPFLGIVQDNSPQRKPKKEKYIEGCEVGDLFNSVTLELLPRPLYLVPCYKEHLYIEWKPRSEGGGFVAAHSVDSPVVREAKQQNPGARIPLTPEGNELKETFQLYCLILDSPDATESGRPIVLSFTSTKIKSYKRIMTPIRTYKPKNGKTPPLFANVLKVDTFDDSNSKGDFKGYRIEFAKGDMESTLLNPETHMSLMREGFALKKAVEGGAVKADHNSTADNSDEDEETPF